MANLDEFDRLFRTADLDRDGRISGAEAVSFFKGSGLPQATLAKVWQFADQRQGGFLSRFEFHNALRLVTVAQSGRDLTPEIVQAALKPDVASQIPPPRMSLPPSFSPPLQHQNPSAPLIQNQPPNPSAPNMIRPNPAGMQPAPGSFNSQLNNPQRQYPSNFPPQSFPNPPQTIPGNPPSSWPVSAFPNQNPNQIPNQGSATTPANLVNENTLNAGLLLKGKTPMDDKLGSFVSDFGAYSLQGKPGYQPKKSDSSPNSTPPSSFKAVGSLISEKNALRDSRASVNSANSSPNVASMNAPIQLNAELSSFSLGGTVNQPPSKSTAQSKPAVSVAPKPATSFVSSALSNLTATKPAVPPTAEAVVTAQKSPAALVHTSAPTSTPNQSFDFFNDPFSEAPSTQTQTQILSQPSSSFPTNFPTEFPTSFPEPEAVVLKQTVAPVEKNKPALDFQSDFFGLPTQPKAAAVQKPNQPEPTTQVRFPPGEVPKPLQSQKSQVPNVVPPPNPPTFDFFQTETLPTQPAPTSTQTQPVIDQFPDLSVSSQPTAPVSIPTPVSIPAPVTTPLPLPVPIPASIKTPSSTSGPVPTLGPTVSGPVPFPNQTSFPGSVPNLYSSVQTSTFTPNSLPFPGPTVPAPGTLPVPAPVSAPVPGSQPGSFPIPSLGPTVPWPKMAVTDAKTYTRVFASVDRDRDGKITGEEARQLFLTFGFQREILKQVWELSDQDGDGMLSLREFCSALYLFDRVREGRQLPPNLPKGIHFDEPVEDVRSVNAAIRIAEAQRAIAQSATGANVPAWKFDPSMLADVSSTTSSTPNVISSSSPSPSPPAPILTTVGQMPVSAADGSAVVTNLAYRTKVPPLEPKRVSQLDFDEAQNLKKKFSEAEEVDKRIFDEEAALMNAKQKIDFYKTKMVEIITFKSRCDNRLNEVLERAAAEKREVEELAKKYDDNYKKMEGVASRLSQEELLLKDLQEKKTELYKAVVRLQQGGNSNSYLQEKTDKLGSELEELRKIVNKRAKDLGLKVRPIMGSDELPFGWQSGLQENAIEWDDEWDEFNDEGYSTIIDFGDGLSFEEKDKNKVNDDLTSKLDENNADVEKVKPEEKSTPDVQMQLDQPTFLPENDKELITNEPKPEPIKDEKPNLLIADVSPEKDKIPLKVAEKIQLFESRSFIDRVDHTKHHPKPINEVHVDHDHKPTNMSDYVPKPTKIPKPVNVLTKDFGSFGNDSPKFQGESPKILEKFEKNDHTKPADRYADVADSQEESLFVPHLAYNQASTSQTSRDGFNWSQDFTNFNEEGEGEGEGGGKEKENNFDNRASWFSDFNQSDYSSHSEPKSSFGNLSQSFQTDSHVRDSSISESIDSEARTFGFGSENTHHADKDAEEDDPFASIGTYNKPNDGPSALHFDAFFSGSGTEPKPQESLSLGQSGGFGSFHDVAGGHAATWHDGMSDGFSGEIKHQSPTATSTSTAWSAF